MRFAQCGLLLIVILAVSSTGAFGSEPPEIFRGAVGAVVQLSVEADDGEPIASGSGFVVSLSTPSPLQKRLSRDNAFWKSQSVEFGFPHRQVLAVVTNFHVIRGGCSIEVATNAGTTGYAERVLAEDRLADIAVLGVKFEREVEQSLELAAIQPQVGEDVFCIGSPLGLDFTFSSGIVSGLRSLDGSHEQIQVSNPISPGSSGGPLLNQAGQVVGVITSSLVKGQNLNFAVSTSALERLFRDDDSRRYLSTGCSFDGKVEAAYRNLMMETFARRDSSPGIFQAALKIKGFLGAIDEQRFDDAINGLDTVLDELPGEFEYLIRYYKAQACFAICRKDLIDGVSSYQNSIDSVRALPHYSKGVSLLRQSIKQRPDFLPAYDDLLRFYYVADDGESALPVANRFVELMPDSHVAYRWRSRSHFHLDDYSSALKDIDEAVSLHPSAAENHIDRGGILNAMAEFENAANAYLTASKLGDNYESMGIYAAAMSLKQGGRYEKAIELFRQLDSNVLPAEQMISECSRLLVPSR